VALQVVVAADGYDATAPKSPQIEFYSKSGETGAQYAPPERYRRSTTRPASPVPVRNYHEALFGSERPTRSTVRRPLSSRRYRDSAVQPAGGRRYPMTLDDGTMPASQSDSGIRHAEYQSPAADAPRQIQQIGGTDPRTAPAPRRAAPPRRSTNPSHPLRSLSERPTRQDPAVPSVSEDLNADAPLESAIGESMRRPRVTIPSARHKELDQGFSMATVSSTTTPVVSIEWTKKSDINVGQECKCELVVSNTGTVSAADLVVDAFFPATVRLTGAKPEPAETKDHLSWSFDLLLPGEKKVIAINMIPSQRGELATNATVRFTGTSLAKFTVEEPLLEVAVSGPKEVKIGEPAPHNVTVTNPGTGVAKNVEIEVELPKGLEHVRGERLVMEIGALNPGEERTVSLSLTAAKGGPQSLRVKARAAGSLEQSASSTITVVAPSLHVAIDGPALRYLKRAAKYTLTVSNDGQAATNNVRLMHKVPEGFKYLGSDKGGKYDFNSKTVSWFIGRIESQESVDVKVQLEPVELGDYLHQVRAISEHGAVADAKIETQVEGTASLVLEIVDLNDPVEIDTETAYEIRVRNNGSKAARAVGVSCELPGGVELVSAKGPADHIAESGLVVFKAIEELTPGKTAVYRIHVRGTTEGNHRFRARLTSDSILEPLVFEELTKFYAD
jgi:hypothetical protein